MELDRLRLFYYTAKEKNVTRAAKYLGLTKSALSRNIQNLEKQISAALFIRHPRGLILTKQGEILFEHAKNIMTEVELAKNEISGLTDKVIGELTITTSYGYASTVLSRHICNFLKLYPDITLNIICDDIDLDLTKKEADIALRTFDMNATELEQIFLHERTLQLFASKEYLSRMGVPKKPKDLENHRLIIFDPRNTILQNVSTIDWLSDLMMTLPKKEPIMRINSVELLAQVADAGLGIVSLSNDSLLLEKYEFVRVLPMIEGPKTKMYYSYPKSIEKLKIVNLLGHYLKEAFRV